MNYTAGGPSRLPVDELALAVARIRGMLLTQEKAGHAVHLLARGIKDSTPGAGGSGVSLIGRGGEGTSSGFTDAVVEQADALQYGLREGPCFTAWATERVVIVDDVHTDSRWPAWQSAIAALPVRSVVSAPLVFGEEGIGTLKIYASLPGQFHEDSGRVLSLFAGTAATLLAHIQGADTPLRINGNLKAALASRDTINRACGALMEREGISQDDAMKKLVRKARESGLRLIEVSEKLLTKAPPEAR
ncbi:GAF and ANTAR domain-containing protein [Arthrobacter sp. KFRI-F3372]|uniref:GAF and ANTAR domain-containing protein n=1 Tax=Pseudarthrobacter TaxID=1742993 RepID=UPI00203AA386|nr:GAF and ANTAR domain-containing protein [Pseudarthrobacter sp. NCCP-2145]WHP58485.1 GAF and ANTAR domain-containing protein [Arthrobacter sp. KFRI-F3372]GKV72729.1 transcriptional regulator [Pseudarthrobacter sp. NCCP-2145]